MPNFKFKLPSCNWLIFLSVSGTITSLILYDRHEKKKAQRKWCTLVSHLSREPLDTHTMPRKLTVFLSAPPGDGLRASRDYFNEYVKPVLVAGAVDWDVVEGRREGDVRAGLAEKIRKLRQKDGEGVQTKDEDEPAYEDIVGDVRKNIAVHDWDGTGGDVVIGRHTWKEYIRGLHEGWLGPLEPPPPPQPAPLEDSPPMSDAPASTSQTSSTTRNEPAPPEDSSPAAAPTTTPTDGGEPPKPAKPAKPDPALPPYISTVAYATSTPPASLPAVFEPSSPLPLPHILGFLNTPTRIYRFLTRRQLADQVGRETAAAVLATQARPYSADPASSSPSEFADGASLPASDDADERAHMLAAEELDWNKHVRKRAEGDETERVWLDPVVLDARIAERMRRFELSAEDGARARRIADGKEGARDERDDREALE